MVQLRLGWLAVLALSSCMLCSGARDALAQGSMAKLDDEYGFRGLGFGDDLLGVKGLKKAGERGECETAYTRPKEDLHFEGVTLTGVEYSFQNDRFTVVSLLAADANCVPLYQALRKAYGDDTTRLGDSVASKPFWTASWNGKRVRIDLNGPKGCTATITAPEEAILEERRCREDDRVKGGAGDRR